MKRERDVRFAGISSHMVTNYLLFAGMGISTRIYAQSALIENWKKISKGKNMIKLNDMYWLDTDEQQFIVGKKSVKEKGKFAGEPCVIGEAYFATLSGVVNFLVMDEIRRSVKTSKNVQDLLKKAGEVVAHFQDQFGDELRVGKLTPKTLREEK